MWDLCRRIPSLEQPELTVLDETVAFNKEYPIFCNTRFLINCGQVDETQHDQQLDPKSGKRFLQMLMTPDEQLGDISIEEWFDEDFINSNMWQEFRTKLAFQECDSVLEYKTYLLRFLHLGEGTEEHKGILHFKYNEYDSLVKPILVYLEKQGVRFRTGAEVTDLTLKDNSGETHVVALTVMESGTEETISLSDEEYVFLTSGSLVQNNTYGDNKTVAPLNNNLEKRGCFTLWEKLAAHDEKFGHPEKFISDIDKTNWISFSLTIKDYPQLIQTIEELTKDYDGCAGMMTIKDSPWLINSFIQHNPFFPDQPENVQFSWHFGLHPWEKGTYIKKPMSDCNGDEILSEFLYHLGLKDKINEILPHVTVRTSMMPYITSQFMPRKAGDRPQVIPKGCVNLSLMGQFVETGDCVFTVETSIRSAMMAVYGLLKLNKPIIPIAPTQYDIRVIASMVRMSTGNGETLPEIPGMSKEKVQEFLMNVPSFIEDI